MLLRGVGMDHRSCWLELDAPDRLRAKPFAIPGVAIVRLRARDRARAQRLWTEAGRGFWSEREDWSPERWRSHLDAAGAWFGAAALEGEDAGFFELLRDGDAMKLEGLGLLPVWRGRGLGAGLLTAATRQAFALGARRVWLHTATDDHPHALPNYLSRGYRVFREGPLAHPMPDPRRTD